MRGRAVRRVPERSMEVEAVVSYSLIPPEDAKRASEDDDGRVEPRLTILPMERKVRSAEIAAPSSEEAAAHGARFEARPIDALPPDPRARRRRRPGFAIVGAAALLIGFGVLAATFSKVMTGNAPAVTETATDAPASVVLAPPPPVSEDTAGPGVRIIAPDGNTGSDSASAGSVAPPAAIAAPSPINETPAANTAALEPAPAPSAAPANPPLPRLRPTTPTVASLPAPTSAGTAAAPAAQGDDVGAMMSDIDRILAEHKAATTEPAPLAPAPLAPPMATADAGRSVTGPAPLEVLAPPPPARRGWFLYPNRNAGGMPVPPADIPDPEGAPGQ